MKINPRDQLAKVIRLWLHDLDDLFELPDDAALADYLASKFDDVFVDLEEVSTAEVTTLGGETFQPATRTLKVKLVAIADTAP